MDRTVSVARVAPDAAPTIAAAATGVGRATRTGVVVRVDAANRTSVPGILDAQARQLGARRQGSGLAVQDVAAPRIVVVDRASGRAMARARRVVPTVHARVRADGVVRARDAVSSEAAPLEEAAAPSTTPGRREMTALTSVATIAIVPSSRASVARRSPRILTCGSCRVACALNCEACHRRRPRLLAGTS